jgi:hypothetical protein
MFKQHVAARIASKGDAPFQYLLGAYFFKDSV